MGELSSAAPEAAEDMLPEYDFSNGVRGKHYEAYQAAMATAAIAPVEKSPDGI